MLADGLQLISVLGAGDDGASYLAERTAPGEVVEVRVLERARRSGERWVELVRRLTLASLLESPGVVGILDSDLRAERPYVILPWVGHLRISEWMESGGRPLAEVLPIVLPIAEALAEAHRAGLVHGALSPGTIALGPDGRPRLDLTGLRTRARSASEEVLEPLCRAPELARHRATAAGDAYALGASMLALLTGSADAPSDFDGWDDLPDRLGDLLRILIDPTPEKRPSLSEVVADLRLCSSEERSTAGTAVGPPGEASPDWQVLITPPADSADSLADTAPTLPSLTVQVDQADVMEGGAPAARLGRFRLQARLGRGAMGEVYRAIDPVDGGTVAIKLLSADWAASPGALERFLKEARLLSEVRNPWVANLIEVNEDAGVHYLVVEYVEGESLERSLDAGKRYDEQDALAILADVARALVDAHRRGIVHRDVKPANILVSPLPEDETAGGADRRGARRVKLVDFGIARFAEQSESMALTATGAALGTPLYMAPEQCTAAEAIGPPADIYAMGATLFHLMSGRPVFLGDDPMSIMLKQVREAPPRITDVCPGASVDVAELIDRTLAKDPTHRLADAEEFLEAAEHILTGGELRGEMVPRLPTHNPDRLRVYRFEWTLDSSPDQLWPFVSNTDRLNRAVGLPSVQRMVEPHAGRLATSQVEARILGFPVRWREYPFDWIENRQFSVLREFDKGPLKWYVSTLELEPLPGRGARLVQTVRVCPRNILGRLMAALQVGRGLRKQLDRLYPRIDALLSGTTGAPALRDPFEGPPKLGHNTAFELETASRQLEESGVSSQLAARLIEYIQRAPEQGAARIRPLALAPRLDVDSDELVDACLVGVEHGLLVLLWDIICPSCRIPSQIRESLREIEAHARCEVCDLDFDLDFEGAVEAIFRVHPHIRSTEVRTYCIGGPALSPHVAVQLRLDPGAGQILRLTLDDGAYRLRSPQVPGEMTFRVGTPGETSRLEATLGGSDGGGDSEMPVVRGPTLTSGYQVVRLTSGHDQPITVRIERRAAREEALSAAYLSGRAVFRRLFPDEVLRPECQITATDVSLLAVDLGSPEVVFSRLGDAAAHAVVEEYAAAVEAIVELHRGVLLRSLGTVLLAVLDAPVTASAVARAIPEALSRGPSTASLSIRLALDRGPALLSTAGGRLEYFGRTVARVLDLVHRARPGEILASRSVGEDPTVAQAWQRAGVQTQVVRLFGGDWGMTIPLADDEALDDDQERLDA